MCSRGRKASKGERREIDYLSQPRSPRKKDKKKKKGRNPLAKKKLFFVGIRKVYHRNYHNKFLCLLCKEPWEAKRKCCLLSFIMSFYVGWYKYGLVAISELSQTLENEKILRCSDFCSVPRKEKKSFSWIFSSFVDYKDYIVDKVI